MLILLRYLRLGFLMHLVLMTLSLGSRSTERKTHLIHANWHFVSSLNFMLMSVFVYLSAKVLL